MSLPPKARQNYPQFGVGSINPGFFIILLHKKLILSLDNSIKKY